MVMKNETMAIPKFSAYTEMFLPNIMNCFNDVSGPMSIIALLINFPSDVTFMYSTLY